MPTRRNQNRAYTYDEQQYEYERQQQEKRDEEIRRQIEEYRQRAAAQASAGTGTSSAGGSAPSTHWDYDTESYVPDSPYGTVWDQASDNYFMSPEADKYSAYGAKYARNKIWGDTAGTITGMLRAPHAALDATVAGGAGRILDTYGTDDWYDQLAETGFTRDMIPGGELPALTNEEIEGLTEIRNDPNAAHWEPSAVLKWFEQTSENSAERAQEALDSGYVSPVQKATTDVVSGAVSQLPHIAAEMLLPGTGLAFMAAGVYGNTYYDGVKQGLSPEDASLRAVLMAGIEVATEKMWDVPGLYGGGALDKKLEERVLKKYMLDPSRGFIVKTLLASPLTEGAEEMVASVLDNIIDKKYLGKYDGMTNKEMLLDMAEDALMDGLMGVATSIVMSGGQVALGNTNVSKYEADMWKSWDKATEAQKEQYVGIAAKQNGISEAEARERIDSARAEYDSRTRATEAAQAQIAEGNNIPGVTMVTDAEIQQEEVAKEKADVAIEQAKIDAEMQTHDSGMDYLADQAMEQAAAQQADQTAEQQATENAPVNEGTTNALLEMGGYEQAPAMAEAQSAAMQEQAKPETAESQNTAMRALQANATQEALARQANATAQETADYQQTYQQTAQDGKTRTVQLGGDRYLVVKDGGTTKTFRAYSEALNKNQAKAREYGRKLGSKVMFVDSLGTTRTKSGLDWNVNAMHTADGTILISAESKAPVLNMFMHELTHHLEQTKSYQALKDYVLGDDMEKLREAFDNRAAEAAEELGQIRAQQEQGIAVDEAKVRNLETWAKQTADAVIAWANELDITEEQRDAELVARYCEEFLNSDRVVRDIVRSNMTLAQRIGEGLRNIIAKMKGEAGSEIAKLTEMEKLFADAIREQQRGESLAADTRYSAGDYQNADESDVEEIAHKAGLGKIEYAIKWADLRNNTADFKLYMDAKNGHLKAATKLISKYVKKHTAAIARLGDQVFLLPVEGKKGTSRNAIPLTMAQYVSETTGQKLFRGIQQQEKLGRMKMTPEERFADEGPSFDIDESISYNDIAGKEFVIIDDNTTYGSTLRKLSEFITEHGGKPVGGLVLTIGGDSADHITAKEDTWKALEREGMDNVERYVRERGYAGDITPESIGEYRAETILRDLRNERRNNPGKRSLVSGMQGDASLGGQDTSRLPRVSDDSLQGRDRSLEAGKRSNNGTSEEVNASNPDAFSDARHSAGDYQIEDTESEVNEKYDDPEDIQDVKDFLNEDGRIDLSPAATGMMMDYAQDLTGNYMKGQLYGYRDLARFLDDISGGNKEIRSWLNRLIEAPLRNLKKPMLENHQKQLDGLHEIVDETGITSGTKESAAVQWYGEGYRQLEDGTREDYTLDDLKREFPDKWEDIVKAEEYCRQVYDEYVDRINDALKKVYPNVEQDMLDKIDLAEAALAQAEYNLETAQQTDNQHLIDSCIQKRDTAEQKLEKLKEKYTSGEYLENKRLRPKKDYFHHFQSIESNGLGNLKNVLRANKNAGLISPDLVGKSEFTKPKSKWTGFLQHQGKGYFDADAIGGLAKYINEAEYIIAVDPYIAHVRNVVSDLAKATKMTRNANSAIMYLTRFANDLAGKQASSLDRLVVNWNNEAGRKVLNGIIKFNNRVKANSVMGNITSSIKQISNIPNAMTMIKDPVSWGKGIADYLSAMKSGEMSDLIDSSVFMTERYMDSSIDQFKKKSILDKPKQFAAWMLGFGDEQAARMIWFSAYEDGVRRGEADPVEYADDITRRSVAGRGIGEIPYEMKGKMENLLMPYQIEVNNSWQNLIHIVGEKDAGALMRLMIGSHLVNMVTQAISGANALPDVLGIIIDAIKKIGKRDDDEEEESVTDILGEALKSAGGEVMGSITGVGVWAPVLLGMDKDTGENLFGESSPTTYGQGIQGPAMITEALMNLSKYGKNADLVSPALKLAMPWGGTQLARTYNAAQDLGWIPEGAYGLPFGEKREIPGSYSPSGNLRFKIDGLEDTARALLFGSYATSGGKEYLETRKPYANASLVEKTSAAANAAGVDASTFLDAWKGADANGKGGVSEAEGYGAIGKMDGLTDDQRASLYMAMFPDSKKTAAMTQAEEAGVNAWSFMDAWQNADAGGNGNGYVDNKERTTAVGGIAGLTDEQRSLLWILMGGSEKSNPWA